LEGTPVNNEILVRDWMSSPARVVEYDTSVADAYNMMMRMGIRRLPVVDEERLVGIVTLGDLREARPSSSASLSIYELNYLIAKLTVSDVMTHDPYTVTPFTPMRQAAHMMLEHKISGLPVVDEDARLVGIITETDMFRMLIDRWDLYMEQRSDPVLMYSPVGAEAHP
jgi:acetoin utilization protein AcuB